VLCDDSMLRCLCESPSRTQTLPQQFSVVKARHAGAVSLVVGGIGIMNITLVSVAERTREIGLRLSVGARSAAILQQFLTEAVVLSTSGGAIGAIVGIGGALSSQRSGIGLPPYRRRPLRSRWSSRRS
jgi:putative ABC transport system permease protein